ncbi:MAG: DUF4062 domain-containing protein [Planctomycetes bacterium]|nr:DUF4062 domain-containing protein [Planctomycetota bacterium]
MAIVLPQVFVSATSRDLGSHRAAVAEELRILRVDPVVQPEFPPDHRTVVEMLTDRLRTCDAVVALVGRCFGAAPSDRPDRSYTQLELDLATASGKPVWVFVAREDADFDPQAEPEDERRQALQRAHREAVARGDRLYVEFRSVDELRRRVAELAPSLPRSPARVEYRHPVSAPAVFVGRERESRELTAALRQPAPCLVLVPGLPGQGKTTLVAHVLGDPASLGFVDGFWCCASERGYTFDAFLDDALGHWCGAEAGPVGRSDRDARVDRLLGVLRRTRAVVAIDGAEAWFHDHDADPQAPASAAPPSGRGFERFVRGATGLTGGSHVVLTTRVLPPWLDGLAVARVPVPPPGSDDDARLEGLDAAGAEALVRSLGAARDLTAILEHGRALGNHPLALSLLALRAKRGEPMDVEGGDDALSDRVGALLDRVVADLADPAAASVVLAVLGCAIGPLPRAALEAVAAPRLRARGPLRLPWRRRDEVALRRVRAAVADLSAWSIVRRDADDGTLSASATARARAAPARDRTEIDGALARWFAAVELSGSRSASRELEPRVIAVEHALRARDGRLAVALLLGGTADGGGLVERLATRGLVDTASDLLARAEPLAQAPLDRTGIRVARSAVDRAAGRLEAAERRLSDVLDSIGDGRDDVPPWMLAGARMNRGNVRVELGRLHAAREDLDAAWAAASRLSREDPAAATLGADVLRNRARVRREQGDLAGALDDLGEALRHYATATGTPGTPALEDEAAVLLASAHAHSEQGRHEAAAAAADRGLALVEASGPARAPELALLRARLLLAGADAATGRGETETALDRVRSATTLLEAARAGGRQDADVALADAALLRALALLDADRAAEAAHAADAAVRGYDRAACAGWVDLAVASAHARIVRGLGRWRSEAAPAREDVDAGFATILADLATHGERARPVALLRAADLSRTAGPGDRALADRWELAVRLRPPERPETEASRCALADADRRRVRPPPAAAPRGSAVGPLATPRDEHGAAAR